MAQSTKRDFGLVVGLELHSKRFQIECGGMEDIVDLIIEYLNFFLQL